MGELKRKNLVVDHQQIEELARRRGTSESAAVREAVAFALAAEEVMAAVRDLHHRGIDDVFGRLPLESTPEAEVAWPALKSPTPAS